MRPPINIGAQKPANRNLRFTIRERPLLMLHQYSQKKTPTVPPYITRCVHLSIIETLSSGVEGGVKKHSTHIRRTQNVVSGQRIIHITQ